MARPLDFLGIGAAKTGTTSLFHYLSHHPGIWMPPAKEVPFFTEAERWQAGWSSYFREVFEQAPSDALIGKITPQYMADTRVAGRVAHLMPDVRLIVLLRDPVERAYSDWRMRVRVGQESRSFETAVEEQLRPRMLQKARARVHGDAVRTENLYLVRSEYGRVLASWREEFDRDQFFVEFSENLDAHTSTVMARLTQFLELRASIPPSKLQAKYHRGAESQRLVKYVPYLRRIRPVRGLWHCLPEATRKRLLRWIYWKLDFSVFQSKDGNSIRPAVRQELVAFFEPDVRLLENLLGRPVPWKGFRHGDA